MHFKKIEHVDLYLRYIQVFALLLYIVILQAQHKGDKSEEQSLCDLLLHASSHKAVKSNHFVRIFATCILTQSCEEQSLCDLLLHVSPHRALLIRCLLEWPQAKMHL